MSEMKQSFLNGRVEVLVGDLTVEKVDAVVNAANSTLMGGCGVDGAIHQAGGPSILAECCAIREAEFPEGLPTGEAVITTAGMMPSRFVIHTVGPIFGQPNQGNQQLANCYRNSIKLAATNGCSSISFPAISTGAFGYPREVAANVSSSAIETELSLNPEIALVRCVFFAEDDANEFVAHQSFGA